MYGIPLDEDWSFLVRRVLVQVCVGSHDVHLHFDGDSMISIDCGEGRTPFERTANGGVPPHSEAHRAATLLALIGTSVRSVTAEDRQSLVMQFSNGDELRLYDHSESYESFVIQGPDKLIVV